MILFLLGGVLTDHSFQVLAIRRLKDLGHRGSQVSSPPHQVVSPPHHYQFQPQGQQEHGPPVHFPGPAFSSFHTPAHPTASPFLSRKAPYPAYPPYHPPDTDLPPPMPPLQYPLYHQGLRTEPPMYPGSPRFTPRAAGGLGHPPEPSPLRMMRSYDDADILHHHDHSVLVHQAPPLGGETLPRLKSSQRPRPVAKIIASSRESEERLHEEEISTLEDWKAGHRSQGNSPYNSLRRPRQEPLQVRCALFLSQTFFNTFYLTAQEKLQL